MVSMCASAIFAAVSQSNNMVFNEGNKRSRNASELINFEIVLNKACSFTLIFYRKITSEIKVKYISVIIKVKVIYI